MVTETRKPDWRALLGIGGEGTPLVPASVAQKGLGGAVPQSEGDRKRGQYRESEFPRLVTQAVVGDDGRHLLESTNQLLAVLIEEIRGLRADRAS